MSELELELESIVGVCNAEGSQPLKDTLARCMIRRLFYFSGGGTTKMNDCQEKGDNNSKGDAKSADLGRGLRRHVANASWSSFGLETALRAAEIEDLKLPTDFLRIRDADRIYRTVGNDKRIISEDGFIDFSKVFPGKAQDLDIELGSGHGDWIVHQAVSMPDRNHVAVELRADRVSQIFSRGYLRRSGPLENLCVIGGDGCSFIEGRVKPGSAATIFANHPEPPVRSSAIKPGRRCSVPELSLNPIPLCLALV